MKKNIAKLLVLFVVLNSCTTNMHDCEVISMEKDNFYTENDFGVQDHYLILNNYQEKCFNNINFINLAENYLDTCKKQGEISSLWFCKPEFEMNNDNPKKEQEGYILTIHYYKKDVKKRNDSPRIRSITFWKDGVNYHIDFINYIKNKEKK